MSNSLFYFQLGFEHILPLGFDHILFILCLFFSGSTIKTLFWQATAFTFAHSITLALTMYTVIAFPAAVIEPVIALSILVLAIENILYEKPARSRIIIVFIFGLVHGMGFAGVLKSLGVPEKHFLSSLLSFNLGVEFGQITILLLAWLVIGKWFSGKTWYRKRIIIPFSAVMGLIAIYWTIDRTFF